MKIAFLLICFGNRNIEKYIKKIQENLNIKQEDIFYSFTSKYFNAKYGYSIEQTLDEIYIKGYNEVIAQPIFTVDGIEYEKAKESLKANVEKFEKIRIGKPLLSDDIDFKEITKFIKDMSLENTVYICHGTDKKANESYEKVFKDLEKQGIFFANLESNPYIDDLIPVLKQKNIDKVSLKAFLLFKGKHIEKDILGEKDNSINNILLKNKINVVEDDRCLLDYENILDIFKRHIMESECL